MTQARSSGAALVVIGSLLLTASCSDPDAASGPRSTCTVPATISTPSGLPRDLPWPPDVSVTEVQSNKRFVSLSGFSQRTVEELFESSQVELRDNRFDLINTDFEGFEAELYFAKGNSLAGIISLREGPCDGYVKTNLIYDPLETLAGREAVRKTRRFTAPSAQPSAAP